MVNIRLARTGAKKRPFYHIVVTDQRKSRDGRFIERLGFYDPRVAEDGSAGLRIDLERVDYWTGHGAQTSDRVRQLVKQYRKQTA
ncbi:MAG: 30S ribosomal protein S16 [Pseudomonadota bacterium]